MEQIIIYIAGSVQKPFLSEEKNNLFMDAFIKSKIHKKLNSLDVIILDPNESITLGNGLARFGKDILQVASSNFLIIDLREKRGLGVGAEMMYAKLNQIPIISVCPDISPYKKDLTEGALEKTWIHPFVEALSDSVVSSFDKAAQWIIDYINNPSHIKSEEEIKQYIELYKNEYIKNDEQFLEKYRKIKNKI